MILDIFGWVAVALGGIAVPLMWHHFATYWDHWLRNVSLGRKFGAIFVALATGLGVWAAAGLVGVFISVIGFYSTSTVTTSHSKDFELAAIGNSESVEGSYHGSLFLSTGSLNGVQKINYIQSEDGYSQVRSVNASVSRIFEDSEEATVTEWWQHRVNDFWIHNEFDVGIYLYDFHVPAGSIVQSYEIGVN